MRAGPTRLRLAAGSAFVALLSGGVLLSAFGWQGASGATRLVTDWARTAGPAGCLLFVLAQTLVAMLGIVPASLLGIAAGAVYGPGAGFALAAIGTVAGGTIAFVAARSLLRPAVERMIARRADGRLAQLDAAVAQDGWRFVCLLRISPVMPFALTSYALGLTEIATPAYLMGTLASLPALFGYVLLGTVATGGMLGAGSLAPQQPFGWLATGAGLLATAALVFRSGALLAQCGLLPRSDPS